VTERPEFEAYLVERLDGQGPEKKRRSIIDGAKYDPRRPDFWVPGAQAQHKVTPLVPAFELCEDEGCPHHGTDHICNPPKDIVPQLGGSPEDLRNTLCAVIEFFGIDGAQKVTGYVLKHRGINAFTGNKEDRS